MRSPACARPRCRAGRTPRAPRRGSAVPCRRRARFRAAFLPGASTVIGLIVSFNYLVKEAYTESFVGASPGIFHVGDARLKLCATTAAIVPGADVYLASPSALARRAKAP